MNSSRFFLVPTATAALLLSVFPPASRADVAEDAAAIQPTQVEIDAEPGNLAGGLRQLAAAARKSNRLLAATSAPRARAALSAHRRATAARVTEDEAGRVVVDVHLLPGADRAAVRAALVSLGAEITAEGPGQRGGGGTLSARLGPEHAAEAARVPGVRAVALVRQPWRRVGKTTSQGAAAIHSGDVNTRGFTGKGITVGVLSDSYDLTVPHASLDIASGDLPSRVNVVHEGAKNAGNADEGRAMLQIVHDVAPDAALAFSTTGDTQTSFANNIHDLRTRANCDILVDDIGFPDEEFFSDSIVAKAADDVVTSTSLPGRPVAFYSAAGNEGGIGYESDFAAISDADVRAPGSNLAGNLKLSQVATVLTGGGFHNFEGVLTGGRGVVQQIVVSVDTAEIDLQWNDLTNAITNDYKLLVFDASGNYLASTSDTSNAFETGAVSRFADLTAGSGGAEVTYQIVITRRDGSAGVAKHFRYLIYTNGNVQSRFLQGNVPTIFGHSGARQVDAVGAVPYNADQRISDDYSSLGPVSIYFDDNGSRLSTPEIRRQPTFAAPDNVNTTFFPAPASENDTDGDGFPNFSGTSAAAPHAAAAAALLLQAGGGPGSLSAARLRGLLADTAGVHDQSPFQTAATLGDGSASGVSLTAAGDGTNSSSYSTRFFTLAYDRPTTLSSELRSVTINLAPTTEIFDVSADLGFPFVIGESANGVNSAGVTFTLGAATGAPANTLLTLNFAPGAFPANGRLRFGIDRDDSTNKPPSAGNSADLLAGAVVKAKATAGDGTTAKRKFSGTLANDFGTGYSTAVGAGLINVSTAVGRLLGDAPAVPAFFAGATDVGNGFSYLPGFGYFKLLPQTPGYVFHNDLGFLFYVDANDGKGGIYLYDFATTPNAQGLGYLYTSTSFPFPYLYSFDLKTTLYYFPDPNRGTGFYSTAPRIFSRLDTGEVLFR